MNNLNINELTNDQLKEKLAELKTRAKVRYHQYRNQITLICDVLGKREVAQYGPQLVYEDDRLYIHDDRYSGYYLIRYDNAMVLSDEQYHAGQWEQELEAAYNRALQVNGDMDEIGERERLLHELSKFTPLEESV